MANVAHAALTGSNLHEPKGVDAAAAGKVYVSDGLGSGNWTNFTGFQAAFRADKNAVSQSGVVSDAFTKVTFGTERFDFGSYYNPVLSRWTPPSGVVWLNGAITVSGASASTVGAIQLYVYKNGNGLMGAQQYASGAFVTIDCVDEATGSDYYELYAFVTGSSIVIGSNAIPTTFFQGIAYGGL